MPSRRGTGAHTHFPGTNVCALQKAKARTAPARGCRIAPVVKGAVKHAAPCGLKAQPNDKPRLTATQRENEV